jgi:hypothetical protein
MSLQKDAVELSKILNEIVASAADGRSAYVGKMAKREGPRYQRWGTNVDFSLTKIARSVAFFVLNEVST